MITATPKILGEVSALAYDVYERLIARYNADAQKFIDDESENPGLILPCAGAVALLLLATNFDDVGKDNRWQEIVRREFDLVRRHIEEKGYDATPFVTEKITEKLFSKSANYYYTDSLSWVLSLTTLIRVAAYRKKILAVDDPGFLDRVHNLMKDALDKICDAACSQGGWNFSNGCTAPHLYYSFAITEALADFGDYVLGETPKIFGVNSKEEAEDSDLIKLLTGPLVEKVNEKRKLTLEYLYKTYLPRLGDSEIEPTEVTGAAIPNKHLLLYYSYFVIEMLVTCNLPEFHREWGDEIDTATELAIYLSRLDLHRAMNDKATPTPGGKTWFDDSAASTLWLSDWSLFKEPDLVPARNRLSRLGEPGLIPLAVRCNAQYAYYVAKGKDSKMGKLFALMLEARNKENGLWDDANYSLLITERAIEALVDYYDYLSEYETETGVADAGALGHSRIDAAFRDIIRDEVHAYLSSTVQVEKPGNGKIPLTETQLLTLLTSALSMGENYLLKNVVAPQLDAARFDMFKGRFGSFLSAVLYDTLKKTVKSKDEKERLLKFTEENTYTTQFFNRLGPWLSQDPKVNVGYALEYLINKSADEQATQSPSPSKPAKRGAA